MALYPVAAGAGWANLSNNASLSLSYQIAGIILCLGSLMVIRRRKRPVLLPEQLNEDEVRAVTDWMQDFEKHEAAKRPQAKSASRENPPESEHSFILRTGHRLR